MMSKESDSERSRSSSSSSCSAPSSPGHGKTGQPRVEVGAPCLRCGDDCEGLLLHVWRKICINCQCPRELHKATTVAGPKSGTNLRDYTWFPTGISADMVKLYMESLPAHCVPLRGSEGDRLRSKLYIKQFPPHDSDPELCHALSDKEKKRLVKVHDKYKARACGVGTVHVAQPMGRSSTQESSKLCAQCNEKISSGHIYIMINSSTATGQQQQQISSSTKAWHPSCFTCTTCNDMLVDLTYFHNDKDDQIYCGRHFAEITIPRCAGCDELIVADTYTNAEDKTWHKEHFCCQTCDKPLWGDQYFYKDDSIVCRLCFEKQVPDCHRCHLPITIGHRKITKGQLLFHEDCYVCKRCRESLCDRKHYFTEGDYCCDDCVQPVSQCFACKKGILPTEKHLKHETRAWHVECFGCASCKKGLVGAGFLDYAGSIFCEDCYNMKTSKKCNACHKPISGKGIQFNFCVFHPECFRCSTCHSELREKISEKEGRLFCSICALKFAKICKACQKPIASRHTVYKGQVYHSQCFKCTQCGYPIGNKSYYETSLKDVLCEPCAGENI